MPKVRLPLPRVVVVTLALFPFLISFVRDWRGWLLFGAPRRLSPGQHRHRARRLRETMEWLGPSFIKGAQVLAQREDILPHVYTRELKRLQDRVPPFALREVRRIIREAFGRDVDQVFEAFEGRPIAAASLGQVHKARVNGRAVAVKVLRPGVERLVETDLQAVFFLLFILRLFLDDNLVRSFYAVVEEYQRMMRLEIDFRNERRNADRIRRNFRNDRRIVIPEFIDGMTTRQVAVIEFIDGCRVDDPEALRARGVEPMQLVDTLIETYVRMVVVHGFIHADPHPGNLLVDGQGRLVILDYGMALEFDESTRLELLRMVYAVTKRDVDTIVDGFYKLGMVDPDINRGILREAAQTLLTIQLEQDLSPRQVQEIAQEILDTFYRFPLRLPNNLVYLFRASSLVEGIALTYDPMFNGVKYATPLVKRLLAQIAFRGEKPWRERLTDGAAEVFTTVRDLAVVIHRMEREQLRLRLHEGDLRSIERFFNAFLRRLLTGLGLGVLAIVATLVLLDTAAALLLPVVLIFIMLLIVIVALVPLPRGGGSQGPYFK
jgi:predicted unusual protein kinase regulating ubiquinone biosynthesis (AarF/ABC1/UbiB family)